METQLYDVTIGIGFQVQRLFCRVVSPLFVAHYCRVTWVEGGVGFFRLTENDGVRRRRYIPDPTGSNILCVPFTNFDKAKVRPHPPVVEGDLWTARAVGILHET